jgi:hypothetical protein
MEPRAGESERVGEIVDATSQEFVAQSVRLHEAPAFGSLVRVPLPAGGTAGANAGYGSEAVLYGVVSAASTGSLEVGGRPIARGHADVWDADIYRENPDLEHVLRTEFRALLVGYRTPAGAVRQHLPDLPPRLHFSVYACASDEIVAFSSRLEYLRTLLAAPAGVADELVAANVRLAAEAHGRERSGFLLRVGRELAMLLRDDYCRLTAVLRRLTPFEAAL